MTTTSTTEQKTSKKRERKAARLEPFLDRDLSWLEFNRRVLHQATDERTPLLERCAFLSIFTSNLDEFLMKRLFPLKRQVEMGSSRRYPGGMNAQQKLHRLHDTIGPMVEEQARVYTKEIHPCLRENGIELLEWEELSKDDRRHLSKLFKREIFPVLTPLAVDPGHPFPFISNLSRSLGIRLRDPETGEKVLARVKIPRVLPQWIALEGGGNGGRYRFVGLQEVIEHHLDRLFPGMTIESVSPFRVTRNAVVEAAEIDDEEEDVLEVIEEELRQRRLERAVRLEIGPDADAWIRERLISELGLSGEDLYEMPALLDYTTLREIADLQIPGLRFPPFTPVVPHVLSDEDTNIFEVLRTSDLLVHHPYESFNASVMRLIETAVTDPDVLAIKMTVYRTGSDSPFIPMLIRAAEAGKQVVCLVELKARFDEQENILIAQALEKAGVHVVYGPLHIKVHTKIALIVRREEDGVRCYAHIGTGNYHVVTARVYDDVGILTDDHELTRDVAEVFNSLTGRGLKHEYRKLLLAPLNMKRKFLKMIRREVDNQKAGKPARIVAKLNQVEDRDVCRALYRASQAGVRIDLIVRGFCILRPGVPGLSENIRVTSIIGRFLEHSRIYYFRNGAKHEVDGHFSFGSADWMPRNLERRVEVITPIEARPFREKLWDCLQTYLRDQRNAWDMTPDGDYVLRTPPESGGGPEVHGSQRTFIELAREEHGGFGVEHKRVRRGD